MSVVYKITYPNGKAYIGQDRTDSINYFGSASSDHLAKDFSPEARRTFTVTSELLWESATATQAEVTSKELEFVRLHRSNDPSIGYNRWPPLRAPVSVGSTPAREDSLNHGRANLRSIHRALAAVLLRHPGGALARDALTRLAQTTKGPRISPKGNCAEGSTTARRLPGRR